MTAEPDGCPPDPEVVARLALAHLPGLGPARGRWLLSGGGGAADVVARLAAGRLPEGIDPPPPGAARLLQQWRQELVDLDPVERWRAHRHAGLDLLTPSHPAWPFTDDPDPPLLLWAQGRLELLGRDRPAVALVGCRRCSSVGARVAHRLGRELAAAGVVVVSGLAAGIDAAAHRGALDGGDDVMAVVGTGADVVYPSSSAGLWGEVAGRGLLVGEAPLGVRGQRWRFPARNRLMAALSRLVVVVESHASGGALHTVAEAERRSRTVLAVPGSVLNPAAAGTNRLLFDGAGVARDALDVLGALDLEAVPAGPASSLAIGMDAGVTEDPLSAEVLRQAAAGPVPLDGLLPGRPLAQVVTVVQRLLAAGLIEVRGGVVAMSRPWAQ